ncbi:MAG: DUF1893 domain-containing protein [Oscillospiraceae bacterium]|nr:DUF1893 domain-containing protein [Oscillospiraceae bacterium]
MSADLERAKEILQQTGSTCVLCRDHVVLTTEDRGVRPLVQWLQNEEDTWACSAADKVVGKAAALLYCLLGVRSVHGNVMSSAAVKVMRRNGVEVSWDRLTDYIRNRAGTGFCPMEQATAHIDDPEEALPVILTTWASLQK